MLDKLDLRVPSTQPFRPEIERVLLAQPFIRSKFYQAAFDLRKLGLSSILHFRNRMRPNHKLELIDTAKMSYSRILEEIEQVFVANAQELETMRVDTAVDVSGIPVRWFAEHIRIRHKRWQGSIGEVLVSVMGDRDVQTLTFGKRPNLFRIYDKRAEYIVQLRAMQKKASPNSELLCSESEFGISPDTILTRVERQMGGGRIPPELATVGMLRDSATFNPFEPLEIVCGGSPEPDPEAYDFMTHCTGMYLRGIAVEHGMQYLRQFLVRRTNRNVTWALEKFRDFLPADDHGLNEQGLFAMYQCSLRRQLRQNSSSEIKLKLAEELVG